MIHKRLPKVSVVIPVYNGQTYLASTIESAINQDNVDDIEIIVVDDGSTDRTVDITKRFSTVRYQYQESQGAAAARNTGAMLAQGEYIAFLDADDLWMPNKLELQVKMLAEQEQLNMVFCMVQQFISPDLTNQQAANIACPTSPMPAYIPSGLMVQKDAFLRIGAFQTKWRVGEFIDWFGRAKELGFQSDVVPEVLLKRRLHLTNTGVTERSSRQDFARILKASLDRKRRNQSQR